jgi:hypothetical protein
MQTFAPNMPFTDVLLQHKVFIRLKGKRGVIYLLRCTISFLNYSKNCISISKVIMLEESFKKY